MNNHWQFFFSKNECVSIFFSKEQNFCGFVAKIFFSLTSLFSFFLLTMIFLSLIWFSFYCFNSGFFSFFLYLKISIYAIWIITFYFNSTSFFFYYSSKVSKVPSKAFWFLILTLNYLLNYFPYAICLTSTIVSSIYLNSVNMLINIK